MENQQNIIPKGCLYGVTVDIEGASALADFEVIDEAKVWVCQYLYDRETD